MKTEKLMRKREKRGNKEKETDNWFLFLNFVCIYYVHTMKGELSISDYKYKYIFLLVALSNKCILYLVNTSSFVC